MVWRLSLINAQGAFRGNFAQGRMGCTAAGACEPAAALAKFCRLMPKSESCLRKVGTLSRKIGSLDARQTEALGKENERSKRLPSRQENKKSRIARQFAFSVAATSHIIYMKEAAARVREKTANLLSRSRATFVLRWLAGQVAAAAARSARFEDGEHAVRSGPILSPGNCHTHPISWGFRLQASGFRLSFTRSP